MPPTARGRERLANGPVDLCSEQPAVAGAAGVIGINRIYFLLSYKSVLSRSYSEVERS